MSNKKAIHIRYRDSNKRSQILIHPSNYPCDLDGCIAPGTEEWEDYGIKNSRKAFGEIIEALGGWEKGKKFELEVQGFKQNAG